MQHPIKILLKKYRTQKEQEDSLRRLNEAFAGIAPFGVNEDLRTAPTGDAKPHTPQKGILEKIGDGISGAAESVSNAAKSWADNRLQNMSMDIYSNLYDPDPDKEKRLEQAHKIGGPIGTSRANACGQQRSL